MKIMKLFCFLIFLLCKKISSEIIKITATKEVKSYCEDGLYIIGLKVIFSSPFSNYNTFILNLEKPEMKFKCFLSFKNSEIHCSVNLNSNQLKIQRTEIIKLPNEFPKVKGFIWDYDSFVKNIYEKELILEYNCKQKNLNYSLDKSFIDDWGFIFNIISIYNNKCTYSKTVEENKYIFNMRLKILDGYLKEKYKNIKDKNYFEFFEYEFLQEIWVPLSFENNLNNNFIKDNDFSFAFCNIKESISNSNLEALMKEGFDFECYIPIPKEQLMMGIIKIESFFDQVFIKINKDLADPDDNEIIAVNLYFNINRTIEQNYDIINKINLTSSNELNMADKRKLRKNEQLPNNYTELTEIIEKNEITKITEITEEAKITEKIEKTEKAIIPEITQKTALPEKTEIIEITQIPQIINNKSQNKSILNFSNETKNKNDTDLNLSSDKINHGNNSFINETKKLINIDYFLIGDQNNKIYCPDKPIFTIEKSRHIKIKSSQEKNYIFMIMGKLSFKYQDHNFKSIEFNTTKEKILFNLQVTDNLAEDEDNQIAIVDCIIPKNTFFLNTKIIIYCYGTKISEESMKKNDTDITLNWGIEKNRIHENIIIRWPNTKRKIKNMFSYTIKAFSLLQNNYGCLNNQFYFYIYIYNLDYEPDIIFEIDMKSPKDIKAICKIQETSILKCYFPLYQNRLLKGTKITLPTNVTYEINARMGNKIIFQVDEYYYDFEDFHLTVKESCGDYAFVGALRKAGLSYYMIFLGVIGIACFIIIIFICFASYINYKIKYRNRKGKYFAYIDEGDNSGIKGKNFISSNENRKN